MKDLTEIENFFKDNLMISNPRTFQFVSRLPLDGLNQLWVCFSNLDKIHFLLNLYETKIIGKCMHFAVI